jgi:imidazolonepropionase-like amidohydrolase
LHATAGETPDAHELLRLATLNGALALGVDAHLGSLEPGKDAEMAFASLGPLDERARADSTGVLQAWADGSIRPTALRA